MESAWELLSPILVMGIGGLLSYEGYQAIKTQKTVVGIYKITGRWAQFVGVLQLIIGLPLFIFGLVLGVLMLVSLLK